jgi:16S rRNA (guanine966-N2)-methyltransferase
MFSALESRGAVEDARVLDLFSGTGALAFEALSRGARSALCVDRDRKCVSAIRQGAEALSLAGDTAQLAIDLLGSSRVVVERLRDRGPFDLILADPPYAEIGGALLLLEALEEAGLFADDALVVLEHASRDALDPGPKLASVASYRYGDTAVAFLTAAEQSSR